MLRAAHSLRLTECSDIMMCGWGSDLDGTVEKRRVEAGWDKREEEDVVAS